MLKLLQATLMLLAFTQNLFAQTAERGYASDQDIAVLQKIASQNGFKLEVDGKWGPRTYAELTQFSKKFALPLNATQMLEALNSRKLTQVYFFENEHDLEKIKKLAAHNLLDPESAKIRNVFTDGSNICGEINGRNVFGAYSGYWPFQLYVSPTPHQAYRSASVKINIMKSEALIKRNKELVKNDKMLTTKESDDQTIDVINEQDFMKSAGRNYFNSLLRSHVEVLDDNHDITSRAQILSDCFYSAKILTERQKSEILGIAKMFKN